MLAINLSKESLRHNALKKLFTNEIDILMLDPKFGVFIIETKHHRYSESAFKGGLAKEKEKQNKRYNLISSIRKIVNKPIPIHTVILCSNDGGGGVCGGGVGAGGFHTIIEFETRAGLLNEVKLIIIYKYVK